MNDTTAQSNQPPMFASDDQQNDQMQNDQQTPMVDTFGAPDSTDSTYDDMSFSDNNSSSADELDALFSAPPTVDTPSYDDMSGSNTAGGSDDMFTMPVAPPQPVAMSTDDVSADDVGSNDSTSSSQTLEDQNIFELLGVMDGTDEEKETFLDELQQVIWEDFLENDVKLLLTTDELRDLERLTEGGDDRDLEKQEKIVTFLEKLIPDLEEIMLEKALELKADLMRERVNGMKEYFSGDDAALATIAEVEKLISQDQWRSAAVTLNGIKQ